VGLGTSSAWHDTLEEVHGGVCVGLAFYMVFTLPNGEQKTSTKEFSNLPTCEVQADLLRRHVPMHPKPSDNVEYRYEAHLPIFLLDYHERGRSRHLLNFASLQGCTA
jgi:hypothetical protein